jgi:hypothetical protein
VKPNAALTFRAASTRRGHPRLIEARACALAQGSIIATI